jgi:hypothetical protein
MWAAGLHALRRMKRGRMIWVSIRPRISLINTVRFLAKAAKMRRSRRDDLPCRPSCVGGAPSWTPAPSVGRELARGRLEQT